jgi:hypothetical protein
VQSAVLFLLGLPLSWLPLALLHAVTGFPNGWVAFLIWLVLFFILLAGGHVLPGRLGRGWAALLALPAPPTALPASVRLRTPPQQDTWSRPHPADAFALGDLSGLAKGVDRRFRQDGHILTCAPTGAGKGLSAVISNLLDYPGSVFVLDFKGDVQACVDLQSCMLRHLRSLIPGQRSPELLRQAGDRASDTVADGFGAMSGQRRTVVHANSHIALRRSWQVQQHREPCRALHQSADRGTIQSLLPTSAVARAAGETPWPNYSRCRRNAQLGSRRCRTAYRTPPRPRRWQPSSTWTSMDLPARSCPAATGATDAAQPGRRIQVTRERVAQCA